MSERIFSHDFETQPLSRQEYISAMVHFYRGELARANTWRLRLDTTTNWAIISTMGLLSFSFSIPEHSHAVIILGMYLLMNFLVIEARRYRFFDVWRNRVRMIEENFYGPLLSRYLHSPEKEWGKLVAGDLLKPRFKISYLQAFRARLVRNYGALFFLLLVSWLLKLMTHPEIETGFWFDRMAVDILPWFFAFALVGGLYLFLILVTLFVSKVEAPELEYWSAENPHTSIPDF